MAQPLSVPSDPAAVPESTRVDELRKLCMRRGHLGAANVLRESDAADAAAALAGMPMALAVATLWKLPDDQREAVLRSAPGKSAEQWVRNHAYPAHSIGRLMELPRAVFTPDETVAEAIEHLRELVRHALVTYGYVVDAGGHLVGVLVFRDLLFARPDQTLGEVMLESPYAMHADMDVETAMKDTLLRHYPEYPIVDADARLIGIVRGQTLFEQHAFELSAQAGRMVGVEADERLNTSWARSLLFRQPWLQLNLVTAFAAAAVVGIFQDTIDRLVVLAVFLPVLAGQSGNTGCQSLAVTLRGMTLGELTEQRRRATTLKELLLGLVNGVLTGATAAAGMYAYATWEKNPAALQLAGVVFAAMVVACCVSGVAGTVVPRVLHRLGADPATASSIFLTTATDVVSMGALLLLATHFVR